MHRHILLSTLLLFCACPVLLAVDKAPAGVEKEFTVRGHGSLALVVPKGWSDSIQPAPGRNLPPTIRLATQGEKFLMLITPLTSQDGDANFNSPAKLREISQTTGKGMLSTARETALDIQELKGDKVVGYYYTLTDKAPAPGSYEYVTSAAVGVGDLMLSVTMLHHEKDLPERTAALEMLKGATQKAHAPNTELRVASPGGEWEIVIPIKGLEVDGQRVSVARKMKQVNASDEKSGLIASVFMEPAQKPGDSTMVRDVYWGRAKESPFKKDDIKLDKAGDFATVQYTVPEVGGQPIAQKNANIYIVHDGEWIDVHLSKVNFTKADQAIFDEAIKGVRIEKAKSNDGKEK
ncbi:MAG TPA: hypothetical protein VFE47_24745 [Tepidisphaeraceae bacterium]|jgi:hypothetical protein|nr:hypothetical protein [Tepidisphaeraceae bacterium]